MTDSEQRKTGSAVYSRLLMITAIGLLDSLYLVYHHVAVVGDFLREESLCNLGGALNCEEVAKSSYAELFGIPVASFGLFYYLLCLIFFAVSARHARAGADGEARTGAADAALVLAVAGIPAVLYFAFISLFLLSYICVFCSLLYVVNLALLFVAWRSPERTAALGLSLRRGVMRLFKFFILGQRRSGEDVSSASVIRACLILLILLTAIYLLPLFLIKAYFVPRQAQEGSASVHRVIELWEKNPARDIPIQRAGSPWTRDLILGSPDAPLTIVEFTDYQCPACRRTGRLLERLTAAKRIQLVVKNYPWDSSCHPGGGSLHQFACHAALMTRCAAVQSDDAFTKMHAELSGMEDEQWNMETLLDLPERLGLDAVQFEQCLLDERTAARLRQDIELGKRLQVNATPTLFIDGKQYPLREIRTLPEVIEYLAKASKRRLNPRSTGAVKEE